jgi:hypothetical protein
VLEKVAKSEFKGKPNMMAKKVLLVLFSYHHKNTEKIANVFASVLNAQIQQSPQVDPEQILGYMMQNTINLYWILSIDSLGSPKRRPSFSQPAESP